MIFVMCINNKRYRRRLKRHVVYRAMRSDKGWRIVDESGVLRDYNERYFVPITLTAEGAATFPQWVDTGQDTDSG